MVFAAAPVQADEVTSKASGGKLTLKGDADANELTIDQVGLPLTDLRVTPGGTTTLDGVAAPQVFPGILKGVKIDLGAGADVLLIAGATLAGKVEVKAGKDSDGITLDNTSVQGKVKVDLGDGDNALALCGSSISGKIAVKHGKGTGTLATAACPGIDDPKVTPFDGSATLVYDCTLSGDLTVGANDANDGLGIIETHVLGRVKASFGNGPGAFVLCDSLVDDDVSLKFGKTGGVVGAQCNGASFSATAAGGSAVAMAGSMVAGKLAVKLGTTGNALVAAGVDVGERSKIDLGKGNNFLFLASVTTDQLSVKSSTGSDTLEMSATSVVGKTVIDYKAGANTITVETTTIGGDLVVKTGDGNDTIDLRGAAVAGKTTIKSGKGTDIIL